MSNSLKEMTARKAAAKRATPQTKKTPARSDEVENNAGGFVFKVSDKDRLERFLILGTDKGTFYVSEKKLTKANATVLSALIKSDERMVVDTIVDVSTHGRAAKQSPALYALAVVLAEGKDKEYAREAVPKVVRTATHLYEFSQYINDIAGWGPAKRKAVSSWFTGKTADELAYQAVKYRQRDGWTLRDVMRKSHPQGIDHTVGNFILGKFHKSETGPAILEGFREIQAADSIENVIAILDTYKNLPWETIPTQFLTDVRVWKLLLANGALGQTALLRSVVRLSKLDAFNDLQFAGDYAHALADVDKIRKGRVHPIAYLNALSIYQKGQIGGTSMYGSRRKDWTTNAKIAGALEKGFYNAFGTIEPANKRTMASIDVSGSMTWHGPAGLVGLDCREAAAAMAMVLVRSEPYLTVNAFDTNLRDAGISDADSLSTVTSKIDRLGYGGTDCALPMVYALKNKIEVDTFTIWTDNETWAGSIKPVQALKQYRDKTGIDARLVVVGMVSTDFTIADPNDAGMLDVVGFDASAPATIARFSAGRL